MVRVTGQCQGSVVKGGQVSVIKGQGHGSGSGVRDHGSYVRGQKSQVRGQQSAVKSHDQGSRSGVTGQGSEVKGQWSRVTGHCQGSVVKVHWSRSVASGHDQGSRGLKIMICSNKVSQNVTHATHGRMDSSDYSI